MNQKFAQPVSAVSIPAQPGDRVRVWMKNDGIVHPKIIEGVVCETRNPDVLMVATSRGFVTLWRTEIGSIEIV